jgi:hypothetical protein
MRACLVVASAALGALAACSDGPKAGELAVRLATPNTGADRAILFTVKGRLSGAVAPSGASYGVVSTTFPGDSAHIAVIAASGQTLAPGAVALIRVNDIDRFASYTAFVTQVVARDYTQLDTTGYVLSVVKP